jgi:hypothetical protein
VLQYFDVCMCILAQLGVAKVFSMHVGSTVRLAICTLQLDVGVRSTPAPVYTLLSM